MEDKQKILDALRITLQLTRNLADLKSLTYDPLTETVSCEFDSGFTRRVNVAMDSGTAMIKDVMHVLS